MAQWHGSTTRSIRFCGPKMCSARGAGAGACKNRGVSLDPTSQSTGPVSGSPDLPDVASLSYEQAREELVAVVQRLEAGSVPLEDSLALWERGEALAQRCQGWLDEARARLAAVVEEDGATGPGSPEA